MVMGVNPPSMTVRKDTCCNELWYILGNLDHGGVCVCGRTAVVPAVADDKDTRMMFGGEE